MIKKKIRDCYTLFSQNVHALHHISQLNFNVNPCKSEIWNFHFFANILAFFLKNSLPEENEKHIVIGYDSNIESERIAEKND